MENLNCSDVVTLNCPATRADFVKLVYDKQHIAPVFFVCPLQASMLRNSSCMAYGISTEYPPDHKLSKLTNPEVWKAQRTHLRQALWCSCSSDSSIRNGGDHTRGCVWVGHFERRKIHNSTLSLGTGLPAGHKKHHVSTYDLAWSKSWVFQGKSDGFWVSGRSIFLSTRSIVVKRTHTKVSRQIPLTILPWGWLKTLSHCHMTRCNQFKLDCASSHACARKHSCQHIAKHTSGQGGNLDSSEYGSKLCTKGIQDKGFRLRKIIEPMKPEPEKNKGGRLSIKLPSRALE